ncbi:hypothetical protein HAP93_12075 [Acidithiobacillus ferriphilus]|uniref:hypothetical protein n=1 Tax=Acidithiobacillus ferriphilus TaxID=1689834 RepID=UPI001C062A27|nr:hypothetical protein [Acidithiobacillus ferriphilus]MBU2786481.1 hypothetical protein [Acidithiobacillus ferriphilus]
MIEVSGQGFRENEWIERYRRALGRYLSMTRADHYGTRWAREMADSSLGPEWMARQDDWAAFMKICAAAVAMGPLFPQQAEDQLCLI